jgi:hypothetical protein
VLTRILEGTSNFLNNSYSDFILDNESTFTGKWTWRPLLPRLSGLEQRYYRPRGKDKTIVTLSNSHFFAFQRIFFPPGQCFLSFFPSEEHQKRPTGKKIDFFAAAVIFLVGPVAASQMGGQFSCVFSP